MSKMPTKKKSCFQITSVIQAQVAASSITDDTESLDDPDESRTEDVSSEIFDVSRADIDVCDRSSSEETLNNVVETQEGQPSDTDRVNGGLSYKHIGTGRVTPYNLGGSLPATAQPFVPSTHPLTVIGTNPAASPNVTNTAPVTTSCSSRFRVIKLDLGTGEPFRRGRWTCTEFYERDSESAVNRTVDSIKPAVTLDHSIDRDSGLGATINSMVNSTGFSTQENPTDVSYSLGHPTHPHPSEPLQHGYGLAPQFGSGTSAFQATGYASTSTQQPQGQVNIQPAASHTFHYNNLNGVHHGAMQTSPIMPPTTQAQQLAYSTYPTGLSGGQPDYCQQHFGSGTQNPQMSAPVVGAINSQVSSTQINSAGPGAQGPSGEVGSAQVLQLQVGNTPVMAPSFSASDQQQHAPSITSSTTTHSSVQNPPAQVPSTTNTPLGGGHIQPQGAHGGTTAGLPSGFGNQTEDSKQKSDFLPQIGAGMVSGRDGVKPFISEGLSLPAPAVKSLFGISIAMNVDEDR